MKNRGKIGKFMIFAISKSMLIVVLIFVLIMVPTVGLITYNKEKFIKKFFGNLASFQGVITLWNVDTFDGGSVSKSYFLEKVASLFEKKNKGVYIKVENLSIDQMKESLKSGALPDMVSFGTGIGKYFVQDLVAYTANVVKNVLANFCGAGHYDGKLLAIPFMCGAYTLISSAEKIQSAGKELTENLKEIALDVGYTKKQRKSEKQIYSLTFGQNEYTGAFDCFSREFDDKSIESLIAENVVDNKCKTQTPYSAYVNYVMGNANVLLGTQRDVFLMENRVKAGKETDVIYQPLTKYCDLVQFLGICTKVNIKYDICLDFANYLLSDQVQGLISDVGMFTVTDKKVYADGIMKLIEEAITEKMTIRNAF